MLNTIFKPIRLHWGIFSVTLALEWQQLIKATLKALYCRHIGLHYTYSDGDRPNTVNSVATSLFFSYNRRSTSAVDHYFCAAQTKRSIAQAERRAQVVCLWHTFSTTKVGRKGRFILFERGFPGRNIVKCLLGTWFEFLEFELLVWVSKKFRKIATFNFKSRNLDPKEIRFSLLNHAARHQATQVTMQCEIIGKNNYS